MVREGPNEPSAPELVETTEGKRAGAYGMKFTAAIIVLVIVVAAWFVVG
jgi:hypothetical protein